MEPSHDVPAALEDLLEAVRRAAGSGDAEHTLEALTALRRAREELTLLEPTLIAAAREQGVSWSRLAPALGVTSRQAAERRFLRLRPHADADAGLTREQRVQAARDRRAGDRAVATWARANAAELRRLAGQISALTDLSSTGRRHGRSLHAALTTDDPAQLIDPLGDVSGHLGDHTTLAAQVDAVGRTVSRVRRETQRSRDAAPAHS
jgi:hypothetical protein